jgi:hypothetical protein
MWAKTKKGGRVTENKGGESIVDRLLRCHYHCHTWTFRSGKIVPFYMAILTSVQNAVSPSQRCSSGAFVHFTGALHGASARGCWPAYPMLGRSRSFDRGKVSSRQTWLYGRRALVTAQWTTLDAGAAADAVAARGGYRPARYTGATGNLSPHPARGPGPRPCSQRLMPRSPRYHPALVLVYRFSGAHGVFLFRHRATPSLQTSQPSLTSRYTDAGRSLTGLSLRPGNGAFAPPAASPSSRASKPA